MTFNVDNWGQPQTQQRALPTYQMTFLNPHTVNQVQYRVSETLKALANRDPAAMRFVAYIRDDGARFQGVIEEACWLLFFSINNNRIDDTASNEQAIAAVVNEICMMSIISMLNNNQNMLVSLKNDAPQDYTMYCKLRNEMMKLQYTVSQYKAAVINSGATFRGMTAQQQPIGAGGWDNNIPRRGTGALAGGSAGYTDAVTPVTANAYQPTTPIYQPSTPIPEAFTIYDSAPEPQQTAQQRVHQPQQRPVDTGAYRGVQEIFNEAEHFAQQEEDPAWYAPVPEAQPEVAEADYKVNYPDRKSGNPKGELVRDDQYYEYRLRAKSFAKDSVWPKSYDRTRFARRVLIDDDGTFHENIVPLTELTVTEMEYTSLETDPEARRQAIEAQQRINLAAEKQPVRVNVANQPERKRISGETRELNTFLLDNVLTAPSIDVAESMASAQIIQQTNTDINQGDVLAYMTSVVQYLGTYRDAELDAFQEFIEQFDVATTDRDGVSACREALLQWRGKVPARIWNAVNDGITREVNKWLDRILAGKHVGTAIDSFADDIKDMYLWLQEKGFSDAFLQEQLEEASSEWYRALKCLYLNRTGHGDWNSRLDLAAMYDLRDFMDAAANHDDARTARRIELAEKIRAELDADESLSDDERHAKMEMALREDDEAHPYLVSEEDSHDAYWMNHSVFSYTAAVVVRIPTSSTALCLNKKGYTHATAATNPGIAKLLDLVYKTYEPKLPNMRNVTAILEDGRKLSVFRIMNGLNASEYLLELQA